MDLFESDRQPYIDQALEVLAVLDGQVAKQVFYAALAAVRSSQGQKPLDQPTLRSLLDELATLGHATLEVACSICEPLGEQTRRRLVAEGRYEPMACAVDEAEPLNPLRSAYSQTRVGANRRELRRALLRNDEPRLNYCLNLRWPSRGRAPELVDFVAGPLHLPTLERLAPGRAAELLDQVHCAELLWANDPADFPTVLASLAQQNPDEFATVQCRVDLMGGQPETARVRALAPDSGGQALLLGLRELMAGSAKKAAGHYAKGLAHYRRASARNPWAHLVSPEGSFLPLAYLLHGGTSRTKQARTLIHNGGMANVGRPGPMCELWIAYERLVMTLDGDTVSAGPGRAAPIAALIHGLVDHWADRPLPGCVAAAVPVARASGLPWVADELEALVRGGGRPRGAVVPLMSLRSTHPEWLRTLDVLEALLPQSADSPAAQPDHRIIWEVDPSAWPLQLNALTQSRKKTGWTKGRRIATSRLAGEPEALKGATDHDFRIVACLRAELCTDWQGYSRYEYEWDREAVWRALAGHPAVFESGDRDQPLNITVARPVMRLGRQDGAITISVEPALRAGGYVQIDESDLSGGRLTVTIFDKSAETIALRVEDGLVIPGDAADRVSQFTKAASALFEIHDEAATVAAPIVRAPPTSVIQLRPSGAGLIARGVVRPFGALGPAYACGEGPAEPLHRVDGVLQRARRDLREERAQADRLSDHIPDLYNALFNGVDTEFDTPESALELVAALALWEDVSVEWPDGVTLKVAGELDAKAMSLSVRSASDWFEVGGKVTIDEDLVISLAELIRLSAVATGRFVQLDDGRLFALSENLKRRLDALERLAEVRKDRLAVHRGAQPVLASLLDIAGRKRTDAGYKDIVAAWSSPQTIPIPRTFQADLRPYQAEGFDWAARLLELGVGVCLADDMGLGKTVQALAVLVHRAAKGPALVVAPTSVCIGWTEEACRFAPVLKVRTLNNNRARVLSDLGAGDLLVTSYGLLVSEADRLAAIEWGTVVLDEAQAIKNPSTERHRAAQRLTAAGRMTLTGTPIENHLGELWAQMAFVNPGMFGGRERFNRRYAEPIEGGDRVVANQLKQLVTPVILRRTKSAVLTELPPRSDVTLTVEPSAEERALYEGIRREALEELAMSDQGALAVFAHLTRLRLCCCNPKLVLPEGAAPLASTKLAALADLIESLRGNDHRALIFSQFVKHLTLVREWCDDNGVSYQYLDGRTPAKQRASAVRAFQAGEGDVFLISLKAGGTGLNLTAADYVVHMDPWWNPAVEDQASDRAHRIGQRRPVTVYRMVMKDTVEEQIVQLHGRKRDLADRLLSGTDVAARLSSAELLKLLHGNSMEAG